MSNTLPVLAVRRPRVLVVGCGGIGGNVAGALLRHAPGVLGEVVALSTNWEIARVIEEHGFRLRGRAGPRAVAGRVITALEPDAPPFDWILLATQPPQVEAAARDALPLLAPDGAFVTMQNGLCEERVARIAGAEKVVGAVVGWGASMPAPGVYEQTSEGGFTLGTLPGVSNPHLPELALLLEIVGPVAITDNLPGARWSKLAFNAAVSTLGTIGGDRLGPLMRRRFVRRLALEIMSEVVDVARAEGVKLEKLSGTMDLERLALPLGERAVRASAGLVARHALMLAVGTRYRRMRSSMLSAIERGRLPAVDFLNGEVIDRAQRHGIPVPVNTAAHAMVHAMARGERSPSVASLKVLWAELGR